MKPSETYFKNHQGQWVWTADFKVTNWKNFWSATLSLTNKLRILDLALSQIFLGKYKMLTSVNFNDSKKIVKHSTRLKKWGFLIYRSEKSFVLADDGQKFAVEGFEYCWPFIWKAVPFTPSKGVVSSSATRASYRMPMLTNIYECETFMDKSPKEIHLECSWLKARFTEVVR